MANWTANLFYRICRWFRPSELRALGDAQVMDLARDIGVGVDELYRLEASGPESMQLLVRRLAQQGVDIAHLQSKFPSVFKDLQRVCSACRDKEVCQRELIDDAGGNEWRAYCPNAMTLDTLGPVTADNRRSRT